MVGVMISHTTLKKRNMKNLWGTCGWMEEIPAYKIYWDQCNNRSQKDHTNIKFHNRRDFPT